MYTSFEGLRLEVMGVYFIHALCHTPHPSESASSRRSSTHTHTYTDTHTHTHTHTPTHGCCSSILKHSSSTTLQSFAPSHIRRLFPMVSLWSCWDDFSKYT